MKEGASNCVERHLNLNDCDTSLLWTYSQVGHKCCFHSQRITPHASRLRYTARRTQAYVRVYTALARGDSKLRFTITAMEQEREGDNERLRKRQATTPHRPAKRSKLLEAKLRSKTVSRPPKMTTQLQQPFPTSDATWEPQACVRVQLRNKPALSLFFFWLVAIRLVACTQL